MVPFSHELLISIPSELTFPNIYVVAVVNTVDLVYERALFHRDFPQIFGLPEHSVAIST